MRAEPRGSSRPLVSIVVPVYGVEAWLPGCLASVQAQTLSDWECIVVIDGSPDRCEEIARGWAENDSRFKVVSVENGGLGYARNVGLRQAVGEWVLFLDSDDEITENALFDLVSGARNSGADIVSGVGVDFYPDGRQRTYWTQDGWLFRSRHVGLTPETRPDVLFDHVAWNKLYRRELLRERNLWFSEGVHCEDILFSAKAALAASSIATIPTIIYRHRRHDAAISADYLRERTFYDWISESTKVLEMLRSSLDAMGFETYLVNFVNRQWWTRMRELHRLTDLSMISDFEAFSGLVWGLAIESSRERLSFLHRGALEFAARGLLIQRWVTDGVLHTPFSITGAMPRDVFESVGRAILSLDMTEASQSRLAAALIFERACRTWLGAATDSEESEVLRLRIAELAAIVGRDALVGPHLGFDPDDSADAEQIVAEFLLRHEKLSPELMEATLAGSLLLFRGRLRVRVLNPPVEELTLVMRSTTSPKVRTFPMWWSEGVVATEIGWSARVVLSEDIVDEHWRCWVRVGRQGRPTRDVLISNRAAEDGTGTADSELGLDGVRTSAYFMRSDSLVWAVRQTGSLPSHVLESLPARDRPRRRVFTFPNWNTNPYLSMLQFEARASGRAMSGSAAFGELLNVLQDKGRDDIINIHWTTPIIEGATSEEEASDRVDRVTVAVEAAVTSGQIVIWTVHNALPHDSLYPVEARRLNQNLATAVSRIHVLSRESLAVLEAQFAVDENKVSVIPHSSYHGVYGARIPKADARLLVGAEVEMNAVLFFGQVRPYKGIEHLVEAINLISDDANAPQLLIAGNPATGTDQIVTRVHQLKVPVSAKLQFIEDGDVSTWFSAADVVVLPYRDILNSGTMMLAATFGVPCVVPGLPHLRRQYESEPWVLFFDPASPVESIAEVLRGQTYLRPDLRSAATEFARSNTPLRMSREYAALLDQLEAPAIRGCSGADSS